ncbi:hypothetical protein QFC21_006487 [Naganishia friedmannii]|uniref:Uncharacterized protein n=1 Tax=Naganishia friedmannii TaxID=89922 RepID=A0ACC2V229_9TREE|nr:hypothetical protein QFC21_006487 [Naganishia friedmannii]
MISPAEINQAAGRTLEHAVVSLPASDNVSPAEPVFEVSQNGTKEEHLATTTANGELCFVGLVVEDKGDGDGVGNGARKEEEEEGPRLSVRVTKKEPTNPVMAKLGEMMKNAHRDDNPNGIISLGVAENSLMAKEVKQFYGDAFARYFREADLTYGDSLFASQRLTEALVRFYTHYFRPHDTLEISQIATGNGVYATLNHLLHVLINPGEVILTSAPYYLGFDAMCTKRCGGVLVGVPMDIDADGWESEGDVEGRMERAWLECEKRGLKVKAVIVTNPGNPIGRTLERDTLLAYCRFAEKRNLHLISDEIYALSVFDNPKLPNAVPFTSILNIDVERELGETFSKKRLHVLHGMSKDFCSNGLRYDALIEVSQYSVPDICVLTPRFGTLISQHNPECIRAVISVALFMKVSSPADTLFYAMLSSPSPNLPSSETCDTETTIRAIKLATDAIDPSRPSKIEDSFAAWFVAENRRRLTDSAAYLKQWFVDRGFKVYPANSGHFLWVDFAGRVGWDTWGKELDGFHGMFERRVYIAPGSVFHSAKPGKMRVSFTVERTLMDKALARLDEFLNLKA